MQATSNMSSSNCGGGPCTQSERRFTSVAGQVLLVAASVAENSPRRFLLLRVRQPATELLFGIPADASSGGESVHPDDQGQWRASRRRPSTGDARILRAAWWCPASPCAGAGATGAPAGMSTAWYKAPASWSDITALKQATS
jgi:hypothetical protein